jgi:hypothetical protein
MDKRRDFMSDEDMRMVDDYITKIEQNKGYLDDYYTRWEKEHEAYMGDQPIRENRPNTRINILHANVEGQVATLIDQNIAVVCRGEGPSDKGFANWARIGIDWTLRQNHIKRILDRHERRRELFGPAFLKLHWDKDAVGGYGLAKITSPPLSSIFVDLKVTDPADLEDAEYIAEVMLKSRSWAKLEYKDKADNIYFGGTDRRSIFQKEHTTDDDEAFYLIQLWTKTDGNLRLIEFSDDGVLLYDSFDDKKDEPFYRYNKYPYFLTIMYPEEGKLYGFGDGKLLMPLQEMLNDLYDQVRIASRPNRVFFDPKSEVDLETLDEDDGPVPCEDPNTNIRVVEVGRVNPALWQLIANVHQEIQRVTRFSELMMGQGGRDKTATESTIQQQQGASATDHKKGMLQETLIDLCKYILDLMMENYTEGKFFRIDEDKDDYEWVDFRQLNNIPVVAPPDQAFTKDFMQNNPDKEQPKWMQLTDEKGQGMTKSVELDIDINIGAGLPKNKSFIYSMAEKLSSIQIDGKSLVGWKEMRDFLRDFLGMPLMDDDELLQMKQQEIQQAMAAQGPPMGNEPLPNAGAEGLGAGGGPMMSNLPPGGMTP